MITLDEIIDLRNLVIGEASSESDLGQMAIVWVVFNRVNDSKQRWRDSISEVIHQPLQFSCFNRGDPGPARILSYQTGNRTALTVMRNVIAAILGSDPTYGANHYHTVKAPNPDMTWPPAWTVGMTKTVVIGNHVFWKG